MVSPEALLARLEGIARSLEKEHHALAVLGLGSVGAERERLDCYSDLDFFAIVEEGTKPAFLNDLAWLTRVAPAAYFFRNTKDGYKLLYEDGIFCEFAVFELRELPTIAYAKGRIIWKREGVSDEIAVPLLPAPVQDNESEEFLLGEALTNLFVGLSRLHRGEKLSASRFVQQYAVERVLALADRLEREHDGVMTDAFARERRFEQRFPDLSTHLPSFIQGYERTVESARALLQFITAHFEVNQKMVSAIRKLIDGSTDQ